MYRHLAPPRRDDVTYDVSMATVDACRCHYDVTMSRNNQYVHKFVVSLLLICFAYNAFRVNRNILHVYDAQSLGLLN